ncbi:polysaccharide deacetylase family protein [Chryseobacterium ginsengisoli]
MRKVLLLFILLSNFLFSQGPSNIATANRDLWKLPMKSTKDFDVASKLEMLVFLETFKDIDVLNESELFKTLGVKDGSSSGVKTWKKQTQDRLVSNFKDLEADALSEVISVKANPTFPELVLATKKLSNELPENLKNWYQNSKSFYKTYILECLRLAAKSNKRTSEINTLDPTEKNGFESKDKSYLLTFDDGPTQKNGHTDKLINILKEQHLNGIFFLSGDKLQQRIAANGKNNVASMYGENWIGSHSMVHKSHQYLPDWKLQIDESNSIIKDVFDFNNKTFYFRPPYGQRSPEIINYLLKNKQPILLWNIDSQDWSEKISSQEVSSRVITLMLLWRKGIILFHDVHPKAAVAVPAINEYFKDCQIKWLKPDEIQ